MSSGEIKHVVVRIRGRDNSLAGSGFFIANDVVLTCAHVIRKAGVAPGGAIHLQWATEKEKIEGDVDLATWREHDRGDIALIKIRAPHPAGPIVARIASWDGSRPKKLEGYGFPDATGRFTDGTVVGGETLPDADGVRYLQTEARQVEPGFSGAPFFDAESGCVVAMIRARVANGTAFGLSAEMIAERLLTTRGGSCDHAVAAFIEQTSATLLPRLVWPSDLVVEQPPLSGSTVSELTDALSKCPALCLEKRNSFLLRLPLIPPALVTATVDDCARALVEILSRRVDGLALLVAAVWEMDGESDSSVTLDERVQSAVHRATSEKRLRESMVRALRAQATSAQVRELVVRYAGASARTTGYARAHGHEVAWAVRLLANVRPSAAQPDPLAAFLDALDGKSGAAPPAKPAEPRDAALLVAIEPVSGGFSSKIWAVAGSKKKKLHDDAGTACSLDDVRKNFELSWDRLLELSSASPKDAMVEFILPRSLMCHDVETWRVRFGRRAHPVAGQCRVVVRSWERLFHQDLKRTWPSWSKKWLDRSREFHWVKHFTRDGAHTVFDHLAQEEVSKVGLEFVPPVDANDESGDDILDMIVDAGIPIAVWVRDGRVLPAHPANILPDAGVAADPEGMPEWVRCERAAAANKNASAVGASVTLLWDSYDRLPPDLEVARENVTRKDDG